MSIRVKKFGGSSVADVQRINHVADIIQSSYNKGNKIAVVVSAMGDTTDEFIKLAAEVNENPSQREYDVLLSVGEQISMSLLAMALEKRNIKAVSFTGWQAGFNTCNLHLKAKVKSIDASRVKEKMNLGYVVIVAGFQGINEHGDITTLGRGGSDTSAVALAAAIHADICEIYTDVEGIYTTDPRIVKNAKKLNNVSFDEMLELAGLGAQVLHPRSIEVARDFGINMCVKSSFVNKEGTFVVTNDKIQELEKDRIVTGIALDEDCVSVSLIGVEDRPGVASQIFAALADASVNVDMIIQSSNDGMVNNIAFTCLTTDLKIALNTIEQVRQLVDIKDVSYNDKVSKLSIVGSGMRSSPGVAAKMFKVMSENKVNIEMISTSEIRISTVIDSSVAKKIVQKLHDAFELDKVE